MVGDCTDSRTAMRLAIFRLNPSRIALLALLLQTPFLPAAEPLNPAKAAEPDSAAETAPESAEPKPAADAALKFEDEITARLIASPAGTDVQELKADDQRFIALWRPQQYGEEKGAVILLHDTGAHADWPGVIGPLRLILPRYGWNTLSLQLGDSPPTPARLRAALTFLAEQNAAPVVLLGHGVSAFDALRFAVGDASIEGLILIGMGHEEGTELLKETACDIFDLLGDSDSLAVRKTAASRRLEGRRLLREEGKKNALPRYRQFVQQGADHVFNGQDEVLKNRVRGWLQSWSKSREALNQNTQNEEIQKP